MDHLGVLLLLALPASGKSEIRRYLEHLDTATAQREMRLGPTVQLDDYPYVHAMRRISQELAHLAADPIFFDSPEEPFRTPQDWLTLIELINQDYRGLHSPTPGLPSAAGLLARIDDARRVSGAGPAFAELDRPTRTSLETAIASETAAIAAELPRAIDPQDTLVVEFARGGPAGASMPLPHPLGYRASLAALDDHLLERAAVLYVWVEPAESRRRNQERARPGRGGDASILHHGVPQRVMELDYGTDDIDWLESQARRPRTIPVRHHDIPFARFDNRVDQTSFLRADPPEWDPAEVATLHADLATSLQQLAAAFGDCDSVR